MPPRTGTPRDCGGRSFWHAARKWCPSSTGSVRSLPPSRGLGPVPSDTQRQEKWRRLAAEVAVYRQTYRIPGTEATAIPADHRDKVLGADLFARITTMHKYTRQAAREPLSGDDARLMHEAAEVQTRLVEEQAPAEPVIDHLRTERAQDSTPTAEQARAERIAELSRRLKTSRQNPGQASVEKSQAYREAVAAIKKARTDDGPERTTEGQEKEPVNQATETRRKLRAYQEAAERKRQLRSDPDDGPKQGDERGPRYSR
jgi:hypothetical protein